MTFASTFAARHPRDTPNFVIVKIGSNQLAFSYTTLIAFATPETGWIVSENEWSATTGKHLNELQPDKSLRMNREVFEALAMQHLLHRLPTGEYV